MQTRGAADARGGAVRRKPAQMGRRPRCAIAPRGRHRLTEASAQTLDETDELEVTAQQLQPAVGGKLLTTKFDWKIPLD
jgi:hypothetical protein